MAPDASTLPLRGRVGVRRGRSRESSRPRELARVDRGVLVGGLALLTIIVLCFALVLVAANRPSMLTPTTHTGYFPRWMAGPLGGLLGGFTNNSGVIKWLFTGSIVLMYSAYALALRHAAQLPRRWVIGAILAVQAIFVLAPPMSLTDLFNYINYGRMEVVYNLNPYTTIPILEPHNDPAFLLSNWHQLLSPYGPLFTLVTFAVVPLGVAGSFWVLKVILALTSLGIVMLVWKCARLLGRDPVPAIALTALNPIVLVWGLGGDHNDFLMMFCIMLGLYLVLRSAAGEHQPPAFERGAGIARQARAWLWRPSAIDMGAGVAFVSAVAFKASAAVLLPVVLAGVARVPRRLVQVALGMLGGGLVLAAASYTAFGLHIPDLSAQSQLVTSLSIPNLVGLALGLGGESAGLRAVMDAALIIAVLACCRLAWGMGSGGGKDTEADPQERRMRAGDRAITAAGWASVALLVTLSWVLPWYVLWALPLAALTRSRALRTATLLFGVYLIVVWVPGSQTLWNKLHFHPEKTQLGRVHQRYTKELLD